MSATPMIGGRYTVERLLGEGGMGSVYLGLDTHTQTTVAIKSLKSDVLQDNPEILQRFEREAEALRKLNHPNIVKVLTTTSDHDQHYIIMEYVSGGSLAELLQKQRQLPIDRILNIALDLADALTRAHRLKIIHRDLKPANVLLTETGEPRLSDFGVAHMGDKPGVTRTGMVVGTLLYLPPEALDGNAPDERGDLWSFGVMLYEMITGVHPFAADTTTGTMTGILFKPAPDVFLHRRDVPWTLMGLVYWMLEKEPTKRPNSARLVGALLENILSGAQLPLDWAYTPATTDEIALSDIPREDIVRAVRDYTTSGMDIEKLRTPTGTNKFNTATPKAGATVVLTPTPPKTPTPTAELPTTTVPTPGARGRRFAFLLGGSLALLAVLVIGILVALNAVGSAVPPATATVAVTATPPPIVIEPVADNEYMVLIADLEHLGGDQRNVKRFISEALRRHFEEDYPFARLRVREYPAVITTDEQAITIADEYQAAVMIWGSYDEDEIQLAVQIGSLDRYAYLPLTHAETRRIANVRVRLTDPRRETLVYNVIAALGVTTALNGDFTEMTQNLLTIENVTLPPAEIDGNSIAARFHRSIRWYIPNIQASLDEVNQAIRVDPGNPFLYLIRALGYQRSGDVAAARQDIAAARRLGAEDWISVLAIQFNDALYFKHDYEEALSYALPFAEQAPTSWYGQTMLGLSYYLLGDYAAAEAPLERAIALNPTLNFPYSFGISLALRQGNIALAQQLYRESLARFPDPTITERLVSVTLNPEAAQTAFVPLLEAFSNLALSQWREVIANTESLLTGDEQFADMYFLRGFAYCNLRDYATAAAEYTRGIELQPDYWLLYAMRAEVRRQGGDLIGAGLDASQVLQSPLGTALTPLLDVTISGELNCENFLTFDFTPYLTTPPAP